MRCADADNQGVREGTHRKFFPISLASNAISPRIQVIASKLRYFLKFGACRLLGIAISDREISLPELSTQRKSNTLMKPRINKCLLAGGAILLCSVFAPSAEAVTTFATLEQTSPTVTVYVESDGVAVEDPAPSGMDFARFDPNTSPIGDVTATIQLVPGFGDVGDFGGFIAGNIALIDRGALAFVAKVENAQANGAVGVLIANTNPSGAGGLFQGGGDFSNTNIPAVMIRFGMGEDLRTQLLTGPVEMHLRVVPEPSSLMLLAITGVGFFSRRRRQKNS
jgi:hypothetical protein